MTRAPLTAVLTLAWLIGGPGCLSSFDRPWQDDDDDASDDDVGDDDGADDDAADDDGGDDDSSDDDSGDDDTFQNQYCLDDGLYDVSITDVPLNECATSGQDGLNVGVADDFLLSVVDCDATVQADFAIDGMVWLLGEKGGDVVIFGEKDLDVGTPHGVDCVLRMHLTGFGEILGSNTFSYNAITEFDIYSGNGCGGLVGPNEVAATLPCNMLFQGSVY